MTVIKVCGVTREEDLSVSLTAGANAIGFNFYSKSPRYLTPARARELVRAVPGSYIKVGVFVNPSAEELTNIAAQIPLDVLQLHGDQVPIEVAKQFRVWRGTQPGIARELLNPAIEAWLLDTPSPLHGGTGQTFDWSSAANFPAKAIIAGGLDAGNVAEAIHVAQPWGVDACSRLESKPGIKDPARVKQFVEAALAAFHSQNRLYSELHS